METNDVPRITVGVMDAPESELAVRWGAQHAQRVGGTLHLIHAMVWSEMGVDVDPVPGITDSGMGAAAKGLLDHAAGIAHEVAPNLKVTTEVVSGNATAVLVGASHDADVIAVGGRGLGRLMSLVVGSKSLALAARAHCPVVIVRGDIDIDGPIGLVHADNDAVIARAGELAHAYGVGVDVIAASTTDRSRLGELLGHVRQVLREHHEDVQIGEITAPYGRSARELIRASEGTSMIVAAAPDAPTAEGKVPVPLELSAVLRFAHTPVWIER